MRTPFLYTNDAEILEKKNAKSGIFAKNFSLDTIAQRIHWMHGQRKHTDTFTIDTQWKWDETTQPRYALLHIHLCAINMSKADRRNWFGGACMYTNFIVCLYTLNLHSSQLLRRDARFYKIRLLAKFTSIEVEWLRDAVCVCVRGFFHPPIYHYVEVDNSSTIVSIECE